MKILPISNTYTKQYAGFRVQMAGTEAELELYGDIVERQPKDWYGNPIDGNWIIQGDVLSELKSLKTAGAKKLRLRINSLGGDAGVAITLHNRLQEMRAEGMTIRCVLDGVAASGGSLIACACDEVEVFPSSLFMVHKCWGFLFGGYNADELRAEARQRDAWDQAQINIYHDKSGLSDTVISHMMSDTTYLVGQEIIDKGFADTLAEGEGAKIAASADGKYLMVSGRRMHLAPGMLVPEGIPTASSEFGVSEQQSAEPTGASGGRVGAPSADGGIITSAAGGCQSEEWSVESGDHSEFRTPNSELNNGAGASCYMVSAGDDPEDIKKMKPEGTGEGGRKTMAKNLEELRAENPELAAQVEADVRAGLTAEQDVNAAVEAERSRMQAIDEISGLYAADAVREAKYGETPLTAEQLAFREAKKAAAQGTAFAAAMMEDAKTDGGANAVRAADAAPDRDVKKTDEQKQAEADSAIHALLNK